MADMRIEKEWVDPIFGKLIDGAGVFNLANGKVDAGDKFVHNGSTYKLSDANVSDLGGFFRGLTQADDVDFVRGASQAVEYLVYKKRGEIQIYDRPSKKNIYTFAKFETPQNSVFEKHYNDILTQYLNACNADGAQSFRSLYEGLKSSAQTYASQLSTYGQDQKSFLANGNPSVSEVKTFLDKTSAYNAKARAYQDAKSRFYAYSATPSNKCEVPDFSAMQNRYDEVKKAIVDALDSKGAVRLRSSYEALQPKAKLYAEEAENYRKDVSEYYKIDKPTPEQTKVFQAKRARYDEIARAYQDAKNQFYSVNVTRGSGVPDFQAFQRQYDQTGRVLAAQADLNAVLKLRSTYEALVPAARQFEPVIEKYRQAVQAYFEAPQPSQDEIKVLQQYEKIAEAYDSAKQQFYDVRTSSEAEIPDLRAIQAHYDRMSRGVVEAFDWNAAQDLRAAHESLVWWAEQQYLPTLKAFQEALVDYLDSDHPSQEQIQTLQGQKKNLEQISRNYTDAKNRFYSVKVLDNGYEAPASITTFRNDYHLKTELIVSACDANAAQDLNSRFKQLVRSTQSYSAVTAHYQNALSSYLNPASKPNQGQVDALLRQRALYQAAFGDYKHAKDSFYVVNVVQNFEAPAFNEYKRIYDKKSAEYDRNCDLPKKQQITVFYDNLTKSAQFYADNANDFRWDLRTFLLNENTNDGDIYSIRRRQNEFLETAAAFKNDRATFLDYSRTGSSNQCPQPPEQNPDNDDWGKPKKPEEENPDNDGW